MQHVRILHLVQRHLPIQEMAVVQVATIPLVLHVLQLHRQDMLLLTLVAVAVQADTSLLAMLVWHPQIIPATPSFLVAVVAQAATIHQARVAWLTDFI